MKSFRTRLHSIGIAVGMLTTSISAQTDGSAKLHATIHDYLGNGGETAAVNVGTGVGSSVLDVLNATADAAGEPVPYDITGRRAGDPVSTAVIGPSVATTPSRSIGLGPISKP